MIYRIFPTKDVFVTNYKYKNIAKTGSNFGRSEVLSLFKVAPVSGSTGPMATASLARILVQFDHTEIGSHTASYSVQQPISYFLKLKNARHAETLPFSYDIEVTPVSQSWDEGRGHDTERFSDLGVCNWDKASSNVWWTVTGSSRLTSDIYKFHVDQGDEDLDVDVTDIVNKWLSGTYQDNGFQIAISSSQECDSNDYYTKRFFSREAFDQNLIPYLEMRYDDSVQDDRSNFVFDHTCSLYAYNYVQGAAEDIPAIGTGSIYVNISDLSGSLMIVTGSHTGKTGFYKATFVISSASYSGSRFTDSWFSGSAAYFTGSFTPYNNFLKSTSRPRQIVVGISNLRDSYRSEDVVRFNAFIRDRDYNPASVLTGTVDPASVIIKKAYYQIENDKTDAIVVPFGTGSVENTRLSYDVDGNYFNFHMRSLTSGEVYRIVILIDNLGQKQFIDNGFKFKVY